MEGEKMQFFKQLPEILLIIFMMLYVFFTSIVASSIYVLSGTILMATGLYRLLYLEEPSFMLVITGLFLLFLSTLAWSRKHY